MTQRLRVEPDTSFIKELQAAGGGSLKKCYQCATCSVVCELSGNGTVFPRKEMLWAQWGLKDRLMADPNVWQCHQCNDCSTYCPRGARPGDVLAAVRTNIFRNFAFPAFMGRALASPKALPLLLLAPVLVLVILIGSSPDLGFSKAPPPPGTEGGFFKYFMPHGVMEALFMSGNVLIFAFAAAGLLRFWRGMKKAAPEGRDIKFLPSLINTVLEIFAHSKFRKCQVNWTRSWAHLLVFYGFLGAMATAGLAVMDMTLLGNNPPIPYSSPIKILGNLSAVALLVGSIALILRRISDREKVGANGYADWLFLVFILIVSVTGVLTQITRQVGPYQLAYIVYFIHIVAVFFLLWYAPYSKFAHMFYRTLALVYLRGAAGQTEAVPADAKGEQRP